MNSSCILSRKMDTLSIKQKTRLILKSFLQSWIMVKSGALFSTDSLLNVLKWNVY